MVSWRYKENLKRSVGVGRPVLVHVLPPGASRGQEHNGCQATPVPSSPVTMRATTSSVPLIQQSRDGIKHAQNRVGSRPRCRKGASSALPPSVPLSLITPGSALSSLAFVDEIFNESFNPASFSPFRSPSPWGERFVLGNSQRRPWHCRAGTQAYTATTPAAGSPRFPS